jgi:hypothetical protein
MATSYYFSHLQNESLVHDHDRGRELTMTTIGETEVQCGCCGATNNVLTVMSTSSFGFPDLDQRPYGPARSAIRSLGHQCSKCGYCAEDLSDAPNGARAIVESDEYRGLLEDETRPDSAKRFHCEAYVFERTGSPVRAGFALRNAAWCADDAEKHDLAREYRSVGARLLSSVLYEGGFADEEPGEAELLITDLMRRAGDWNGAGAMADRSLSGTPADIVRRLLEFERVLIEKRDDGCHGAGEVI